MSRGFPPKRRRASYVLYFLRLLYFDLTPKLLVPLRVNLGVLNNCSNINLDNKSLNDSLTAELKRYKEQVKVLKEGQNIDLKSKDNVSDSCKQSVEIDRLKQILSEHVKEKESLMQTVTLLKNDFMKEESRNIDREITLEKKIKQLDNIVFKRDQSAQNVRMLTKPQFFYDHTTKQALGFQNPFYLKKAQQLEPNIYDGNVIKNTSAIVISDSEETLLLAKQSRLKMLLKQQDPMMLEKKVNTTSVDYAALNQLSQDFETRFVPQIELSIEQAFWSQNSINSSKPTSSCRPTKVEVPKELPKVSMVNTSLKKLKHHLASFDVVVKERTTAIAITEGTWGFEHTKACFRDEIIPFVKALKDLFNTFDQYLIDELSEVQNVFHQMKQAVEQHHLKQLYDSIKPTRVQSQEQCNALALKNELRKLKGKSVIACRESVNKPKVITPVVHKVDLEPLSPKLKNNREAHVDYIRITKENADTLRDIVEQARTSNPLDNALAYACMYTKQIQELLVYVSDTCPSSPLKSEKLVAVTPMNIARKVTFAKTSTTSDNNTQIQVDVHQTQTTSKPLVPSTNVKCSTNASRSKPRSETKNNRIMQPLSSNQKYLTHKEEESSLYCTLNHLASHDSVMSSASSAVTYTSVNTDFEPGRPVALPSLDYVPGPEHPPSPDYVSSPEHPPSPIEIPYVPEPEYPEYLASSDAEVPLEDQPLPIDASPTALSPGYVVDFDPKEDPADGGDHDDEQSDDDDDDTDDEDEEPFEDEDDNEEEEEHLAPANSSAVPIVDHVPSAGDTKAFETDESAPTPRLPQIRIPFAQTRLCRAQKTVRLEPPMSLSMEARIAEYAVVPAPPSPPPSLLSPWSPLLSQIPLPPLPLPLSSLHLPLPVPTSLPLPSSTLPPLPDSLFIPPPVDRREDIPEA
ncbi:hypothetical protein Tco_1429110 [Tanacetum coccineum]